MKCIGSQYNKDLTKCASAVETFIAQNQLQARHGLCCEPNPDPLQGWISNFCVLFTTVKHHV